MITEDMKPADMTPEEREEALQGIAEVILKMSEIFKKGGKPYECKVDRVSE